MAYKKSQSSSGSLPGRQWLTRASVGLMLTASVALMVMSKSGNPAALRLKASLADAITPVLAVAASPLNALADAGQWISDLTHMRAQNIALKNQNLQLLQWQALAKEMEAENRSLKQLLNVVPSQKNSFVTARIVSDMSGPYMHAALLAGGSDNNIGVNQAVISENGLVGRVIEAGKNSARVLLLSDMNSRVPVMVERTREKSIMVGSNDSMPGLSYLASDSKIVAGDRIVTSGDGGIFPPNVPVGVVSSVEKNSADVQLFANPAALEFVSVVDSAL